MHRLAMREGGADQALLAMPPETEIGIGPKQYSGIQRSQSRDDLPQTGCDVLDSRRDQLRLDSDDPRPDIEGDKCRTVDPVF